MTANIKLIFNSLGPRLTSTEYFWKQQLCECLKFDYTKRTCSDLSMEAHMGGMGLSATIQAKFIATGLMWQIFWAEKKKKINNPLGDILHNLAQRHRRYLFWKFKRWYKYASTGRFCCCFLIQYNYYSLICFCNPAGMSNCSIVVLPPRSQTSDLFLCFIM